MTHRDPPSNPDRGNLQRAGADPRHQSGSHGGESGNGQMKPHTEPERTDPGVPTTLQGSEPLGGENGPTYQTGGTQQDRADQVEELKQDGKP